MRRREQRRHIPQRMRILLFLGVLLANGINQPLQRCIIGIAISFDVAREILEAIDARTKCVRVFRFDEVGVFAGGSGGPEGGGRVRQPSSRPSA